MVWTYYFYWTLDAKFGYTSFHWWLIRIGLLLFFVQLFLFKLQKLYCLLIPFHFWHFCFFSTHSLLNPISNLFCWWLSHRKLIISGGRLKQAISTSLCLTKFGQIVNRIRVPKLFLDNLALFHEIFSLQERGIHLVCVFKRFRELLGKQWLCQFVLVHCQMFHFVLKVFHLGFEFFKTSLVSLCFLEHHYVI